ncbi:MAG: acetate/propionate family kinase [Myxococcales bacterium]|nr:acetate/propionate family kinase [Myxococcales bacterium]
MSILVINSGSSSVKIDLLDARSGRRDAVVRVERVGTAQCLAHLEGRDPIPLPGANHGAALEVVLPLLDTTRVEAVGHRGVHGGERFTRATVIDDAVISAIEALAGLAPLHTPANLAAIRAARALLPQVPHVAVFDTAFHATLPHRAQMYALPRAIAEKHGLRRYGFHGTSHAWVAARAAEYLEAPIEELRIITCHLGNGASVCAVEYGRSVETSMGLTPLEGLVMGTRVGDIDPGILLELMRREGWSVDELDRFLNEDCGLAGLSGVGNDMRDIERRAAEGDEACRAALHVFTHRVRKYIGAYAAVMGGVDAVVFTGGIGENSALVRHRVAQRLDFLGARIDEDANRDAKVDREAPVADISRARGRVRLLVVATDEAHAIAREVDAALTAARPGRGAIPIAVSARHVHLTQEAVEALFGAGHQLTPRNPLSQPDQYACEETVDLVGPKGRIDHVRVLGPTRPACQVEVSRTDEFKLGVDAPVRPSGKTENSPGITLVGPAGTLALREGLICAWRHIHMHPDDAARFGVSDKDVVDVAVDTDDRDLVFGDVMVRVSPAFRLEMHIDTDEANAAGLCPGTPGALVATEGLARLTRRKPSPHL